MLPGCDQHRGQHFVAGPTLRSGTAICAPNRKAYTRFPKPYTMARSGGHPIHYQLERARSKKRRAAFAAANVCQRCRKKPATRGSACDGCRKRYKEFPSTKKPNVTHARRAAEWRCKACDEPMPSDLFKSCARCRADATEATKATREAQRLQGLCKCGRKLAKNSLTKRDVLGRLLRKLPKTASRCAICRNRRKKNTRTAGSIDS